MRPTQKEESTMKNANFIKTIMTYGQSSDTYKCENCEGMTTEEILNACDLNNWGGYITHCNDYIIATVYKD